MKTGCLTLLRFFLCKTLFLRELPAMYCNRNKTPKSKLSKEYGNATASRKKSMNISPRINKTAAGMKKHSAQIINRLFVFRKCSAPPGIPDINQKISN